ncbi:hydrogenase maturation protease [Methanosarcina horonobensis]|uniref:hydrogenase maturation protease n=1 Tax=Methanosarcina horonobensis TaxID=418008 RepID=UPI0022B8F3A2|nr:hydrogenase maturation protease [Methanosarcina horonobensis]
METPYSRIVVAGCGNPLYADDGFGPAVVESLKGFELPENVTVVDAGLGGPHFVFTLSILSPRRLLSSWTLQTSEGNLASSDGLPLKSSLWGATGTSTPGI